MEKRRKNAEILDRSIAFFYDMIYQINMAIQEQDLNRKSFKFENHFYNRRKLLWKQQSSKPPARSAQASENNCSYYFPFPLGQRVVSVF